MRATTRQLCCALLAEAKEQAFDKAEPEEADGVRDCAWAVKKHVCFYLAHVAAVQSLQVHIVPALQ
ncbi:MAG: hypothetical protein ACPIOQ_47100, partial [Promethearchaeia archaeon]